MIKYLYILIISFFIFSCSGNPVPEKAVKDCIDKNWKVYYDSNILSTTFICREIK